MLVSIRLEQGGLLITLHCLELYVRVEAAMGGGKEEGARRCGGSCDEQSLSVQSEWSLRAHGPTITGVSASRRSRPSSAQSNDCPLTTKRSIIV